MILLFGSESRRAPFKECDRLAPFLLSSTLVQHFQASTALLTLLLNEPTLLSSPYSVSRPPQPQYFSISKCFCPKHAPLSLTSKSTRRSNGNTRWSTPLKSNKRTERVRAPSLLNLRKEMQGTAPESQTILNTGREQRIQQRTRMLETLVTKT